MSNFKFTVSSTFKGKGINEAKTALNKLNAETRKAGTDGKKHLEGMNFGVELLKGNINGAADSAGKFAGSLAGLGAGPLMIISTVIAGIIKLWNWWQEKIDKAKAALVEMRIDHVKTQAEGAAKEFERWQKALNTAASKAADTARLTASVADAQRRNTTAALEAEKVEKLLNATTAEQRSQIEQEYDAKIRLAAATDKVAIADEKIKAVDTEITTLQKEKESRQRAISTLYDKQERAVDAQLRTQKELDSLGDEQSEHATALRTLLQEQTKEAEQQKKQYEDNLAAIVSINERQTTLKAQKDKVLTLDKSTAETQLQQVKNQETLNGILESTKSLEEAAAEAAKNREATETRIAGLKAQEASLLKQQNAQELADLRDQIAAAQELSDTLNGKNGDGKNGDKADRKAEREAEREARRKQRQEAKENKKYDDMYHSAKFDANGNITGYKGYFSDKDKKNFEEEYARRQAEEALRAAEDRLKAAEEQAKKEEREAVAKRLQEVTDAIGLLTTALETNVKTN